MIENGQHGRTCITLSSIFGSGKERSVLCVTAIYEAESDAPRRLMYLDLDMRRLARMVVTQDLHPDLEIAKFCDDRL